MFLMETNSERKKSTNTGFVTHRVRDLGIRVDLPNRFIYINADSDDVTTDWYEPKDLAEWFDCQVPTINKVAGALEIERGEDGRYPPLTYEIIKEELEWKKFYNSLPAKITIGKIHDILGWHYDTIHRHAAELGYKPTANKGLFPKPLLQDLRKQNLSVPFDEGWLTVRALCKQVGMVTDREWIKSRLEQSPYKPKKRRIRGDGSVRDHYDPEALTYLRELALKIPAAGADMYTKRLIASELGRSENWINRRIGRFATLATFRLDDMSVPRLHYPKEVLSTLAEEAAKLDAYDDKTGWLEVDYISEKFEITPHSAMRALDKLGVPKCKVLKENGRGAYHYNGDAVMTLAWNIAEADRDMIELEGLAGHFNKCTRTISERLQMLGVEPTYREQIGGNRRWYDRSVIEKLAKTFK